MDKDLSKSTTENVSRFSVDYRLFTAICKSGFLVENTSNGRVDITFASIDIRELCAGKVVEKIYFGRSYQFLMGAVERDDVVEILKRSPIFQSLAEVI